MWYSVKSNDTEENTYKNKRRNKMQKKTNEQFMILSFIGIIIVVICHLARDIYKYLEFLPYIAIFVFVSGYFYKENS